MGDDSVEAHILPTISHTFRFDTAFRRAFRAVLQAVANSILGTDVIIG